MDVALSLSLYIYIYICVCVGVKIEMVFVSKFRGLVRLINSLNHSLDILR